MAGKKGRSGRKSFALTIRARSIVERSKLLNIAASIAENAAEKAGDRLNAIRFLVEYAYGKPAQVLEHTAGDTPVHFTLKIGDRDA